jgi:hypothetical protein
MTIEMGNLVYSGHDMHGLQYGAIEGGLDYGVHRAVATHGPGLNGLQYGYEYGADASMMDTVKSKLAGAMDYAKENWVMILGGVVVAVLVAKYVLKVPLLSNPKKRRKSRKRKQTAKQRAASLRNLRKGRKAAGKRRGAKASASRKPKRRGGKRRVTAYQKLWGQYRKMGYSAKQAARMAKGKRVLSLPAGKRRRSRSRSRR